MRQEIKWNFNLSNLPCKAMYERIFKDIKTTLHITLDGSQLSFEQLESIIIDIKCFLNNRPLTYIGSEIGEGKVLAPNSILWGQSAHTLVYTDVDMDSLTKCQR